MENDFNSWHEQQERVDKMFDESDLEIIRILSQYLEYNKEVPTA